MGHIERVGLIILLAGCEVFASGTKHNDIDAGISPTGYADAGSCCGSDGGDTGDPVGSVHGVKITLKGGEVVIGELIATYDHSIWWDNPSSEITYGIFDATKYGEYPDDHCLRFLSSNDIASKVDITLPTGTVAYRDMLRAKGMYYGTVPLQGVMYVGGGNGGEHAKENGTGDFAWDIVRTDASGRIYTGSGTSNSDYLIWDSPLVLPIGGTLVEVIRDQPDNTPPNVGTDQNTLVVHIGGQFYLVMLHMKQYSVPATLQTGAMLAAGTPVGHVGNSGISIMPHLHITLVWYDTVTQRSWGVPSEWPNMWSSAAGPQGPSQQSAFLVPQMATWFSRTTF